MLAAVSRRAGGLEESEGVEKALFQPPRRRLRSTPPSGGVSAAEQAASPAHAGVKRTIELKDISSVHLLRDSGVSAAEQAEPSPLTRGSEQVAPSDFDPAGFLVSDRTREPFGGGFFVGGYAFPARHRKSIRAPKRPAIRETVPQT